jgi:hypothetical protein
MSETRTSEHKGHFDGMCNRTSCSTAPALWWNPHTAAYYCEDCAKQINIELARQNLDVCGIRPKAALSSKTESDSKQWSAEECLEDLIGASEEIGWLRSSKRSSVETTVLCHVRMINI